MYNRELFLQLVEAGLLAAKVDAVKTIQSLAAVMSPLIDVYIRAFEQPDTKLMAEMASEYVKYAQGGPKPGWFAAYEGNL